MDEPLFHCGDTVREFINDEVGEVVARHNDDGDYIYQVKIPTGPPGPMSDYWLVWLDEGDLEKVEDSNGAHQ